LVWSYNGSPNYQACHGLLDRCPTLLSHTHENMHTNMICFEYDLASMCWQELLFFFNTIAMNDENHKQISTLFCIN
jgi:hypothetical protein